MTAETLKPFITPGSVDYVTTSHSSASSVHSRSSRCFLAIAASALVVVLITSLLGLTIWHTVRISNLQTEVGNLNKVIESMQKRLGLTYLDDLSDLEKEDENNNALIDDMLPDDDDEDDDDGDDDNDSESNSGEEDDDEDDDDADYTYDELLKKYSDYEVDNEDDDGDNGNNSRTNDDDDDDLFDDDDLYDDFEKFVESTKETPQRKRKTRSVSMLKDATDEVPLDTSRSKIQSRSHKSLVAAENAERRRSPMRLYSSRRRKFPMIKSAKTIETINALNEVETSKPAVHFHLTHKIPNHPSVRVTSYSGDVYIGKPTWTNERESLDTYFHVENGVLTVHEPGLYYVYAQICYHNHHNQNGFVIFHGHKPFLQCLSHIFTNNHSVFNTCHTSGLIYLKRDEQIHIQDFHTDRKTHLQEENNRSYFGLIKI